jgi:hypothetical protein
VLKDWEVKEKREEVWAIGEWGSVLENTVAPDMANLAWRRGEPLSFVWCSNCGFRYLE